MWDPIPPHPVLDPTSPEVAAELAEPAAHRVVNLDSYGVPVYGVTPATPRHRIVPSASSTVDGIYGVTSALENGPVPIPDGARPAPGCDRKLVMIDPAAGTVFDLFSARSPGGVTPNPDCPAPTPSAWTADWGGVYALAGEGLGDVNPDGPQSAGTGSGLSSLFGLIRVEEVNAGVIDHALVFSTDRSCTWERWPAVKTDGRYVGWPCIPEGARVQLDPSVDLRAIPGITPFELAVGRALQTYGAYNIDNGGARLAFIAERETSVRYDRRTVDPAVDYAGLPHLPWSSLRVLRSWNGK